MSRFLLGPGDDDDLISHCRHVVLKEDGGILYFCAAHHPHVMCFECADLHFAEHHPEVTLKVERKARP